MVLRAQVSEIGVLPIGRSPASQSAIGLEVWNPLLQESNRAVDPPCSIVTNSLNVVGGISQSIVRL